MFEFLKNLFGKGTAILDVSLDITLDPQVIISNRKLNAGGKKIKWVRKDDDNNFNFERINDLNQSYFNKQSISLDRQKVTCNNRAPDDNKDYPYEIVVIWNGNPYNSTKSGAPGDGKPVIRN